MNPGKFPPELEHLVVVGLQGFGVDGADGIGPGGLQGEEKVDGAALQAVGELLPDGDVLVLGQQGSLDIDIRTLGVESADFDGQFTGFELGFGLAVAGHGLDHLLDDVEFLEDFGEGGDGAVHLFLRVRGHEGEAHEGIRRGTGRRDDGVDEHAFVEGHLRDHEGLLQVTDIERDDGALGFADLEARVAELHERIVGHFPEGLDPLRLFLDDVQGFQGAGRGGRRVGGAEDIGAGRVAEVVDDHLVRRDESADGSEGLGEGAHDDVHLVREVEVVADAPALFAEDTDAVGLIHHDHDVVVLVLEFHDRRELAQVAFHGEDAVHDDEFDGVPGAAAEAALQVLHVVVLVVEGLGEGETAAVHDGSVVAVVADDVVVPGEKLGDDAGIHREAGGEAQGFVLAHEFGEFFLQLDMQVQGPVQEAGTGTAGTILAECVHAGLDDALVTGEACIGVGTEHEDVMSFHLHLGALFAFYFTEIGIDSLFNHFLRQVILGQPGM